MEFGHRVTPVLPNSSHPGSPATPALCPADSEPRCSFYRRGRTFLLRVTSSQSAFDNFKPGVDEITFVLPFKKTPGERSVPDKSDFSSPLCVFLGCSSGLCFTPRSNSGQPFPALHPAEPPRCPGDGQAGQGSAWCRWRLQTEHRALWITNPCCSPRVSYLGFVTLRLLSPVAVIC